MSIDIKKVIGTVAPWLATAIGGPFAGQAVSTIASAIGLKPDAKIEDLEKAFTAGQLTGDQMVALKAAEQNFQLQMQQAGFADQEKLAAIAEQDRDSARKREIEVKDWTPRLLAYGVTGGFFAILAYMTTNKLPDGAHDALLLLLGALQTAWISIVSYYFGSSSGSEAKTSILAAHAAAVQDASAKKA